MSQIRSKDTIPELITRKFLFAQGLRYRIHAKELPGRPDLVFKKYSVVLFVNGCFWHGHSNCRYFKLPKSRRQWWRGKIERTKELDRINHIKLGSLGWKVVQVFECELKQEKRAKTLSKLERLIRNGHTCH